MKTMIINWVTLMLLGSATTLSNICLGENNRITDIDGNVYKTVIIGKQEWFAKNLKTTRYNDGSAIPNVTDDEQWDDLYTGAYSWYDNDASNGKIYGALYNWFAVETGKLCPKGWRVPTDNDWTKLTDYLGGEGIAGGKLKATGTLEAGNGLWLHPNEGATNESSFSALPGGYRWSNGSFYDVGNTGGWWSATEDSGISVWVRIMGSNTGSVIRSNPVKWDGFSIRCFRLIDN